MLSTATPFHQERRLDTLLQITLAETAVEMIELRRKDNASDPYLAGLRCRSACFTRLFTVHPASITTSDCQRSLDTALNFTCRTPAQRWACWKNPRSESRHTGRF